MRWTPDSPPTLAVVATLARPNHSTRVARGGIGAGWGTGAGVGAWLLRGARAGGRDRRATTADQPPNAAASPAARRRVRRARSLCRLALIAQ